LCTAVNRFSADGQPKCAPLLADAGSTFSGVVNKGYGTLIAQARESLNMSVEDLARAIGRSPSTIRRIETEQTEPSIDQVNRLASALPLSVGQILKAMGAEISLSVADRLPKDLLVALAELTPDDLESLLRFAIPAAEARRRERARAR
jgi:transcriptional regulator with XRE-family HTH domain